MLDFATPIGFEFEEIGRPLSAKRLNELVRVKYPKDYRRRLKDWRDRFGISPKERGGIYTADEATALLNCCLWLEQGGLIEDFVVYLNEVTEHAPES